MSGNKPSPQMRNDTAEPDGMPHSVPDIVELYTPRLLSYIRRQVRNREDAEDILQDVFYQLVRTTSESGTGGITHMSAWLYRVARNTIINMLRRRGESPLSELYDDSLDDEATAPVNRLSRWLFSSPASDPENIYLRTLVWQELDQALSELPKEQSEVFCLTVFDGIPIKEIARLTATSPATLLSRKHYAVKFLRTRLRGLYEDLLSSLS